MLKLLLLCGGKGRERDISLNSVRSVYDHIKGLEQIVQTVVFIDTDNQKYQIDELYLYSNTSDDFRFLLKSEITPLTEESYLACLSECDLVFPVIHGVGGEDGVLQKELESMGVPFVGSPSSACEKMYNKSNAEKFILAARGMTNIPKIYVSGVLSEYTSIVEDFVNKQGNVCLKPTEGGSSFGVEFAFTAQDALQKAETLLEKEQYGEIVIEKKCKGKEFTVIILDNSGTPVSLIPTEIEIVGNGIFDRRRKYMSTTEVCYHCPARFGDAIIAKIRSEAEALFSYVGARDFLRIDGWVMDDGSVYFSDFNPISGMEQNSFIFQQATKIGFTHITLLEYILRNACRREKVNFPETQSSNVEKRRVNVLLGGITSERQVSLLSGTNVWMKLLHSKKYAPVPHILTQRANTDNWIVSEIPYSFALLHTTEEIIDQIENCSIDADVVGNIRGQLGLELQQLTLNTKWVDLHDFIKETKEKGAYLFVGLHGGFGESGGIQAVLDDVGVDYNGSGTEASALCMDKYQTGCIVTELGLPQLRTCKKVFSNLDVTWEELVAKVGEPIIAKPNGDGCSTGVVKLNDSEDLRKYIDCCRSGQSIPPNTFTNQPEVIAMSEQCDSVLFEEYIKTDSIAVKNGELVYNSDYGWVEITIGVLEKQGRYHAFNPSITISENDILSVEEKFQSGRGINLTPPPESMISNTLKNRIKYFAERVAEKCSVEDYCRIDMFANNKTGEVIVIEINSLPGLSPSTVLFQQAAKEIPTISPLALLERIMESGGFEMDGLTFKEIVDCTGGTTSYTGGDFLVTNIKFDSRENMKETMFVAFVTDKDNGHKYISMAANKGAVAALVSEDVQSELPLIKVPDTKKAYQDIARFYRDKFSVPVIALTGSNGKTTVKDMLAAILSSKYKVLSTEKNLNNELGVPKTILKMDGSHEVAVIEIGMNHHGEIRTLTNIAKPDVAIITKIGTAHMGNLGGTRTDVFRAKMEIAEGLRENGTLVLCGDDDMLSTVESDKHRIIFCGLSDDTRNVLYASDISQSWNGNEYGLTFLVHYQGSEYNCFLPVLGKHNVQNALLALTAGIQLNVPMKDAVESLRFYSRSSMRLETATIRGVKFIKDYYNASPESAQAALDTLSGLDTTGSRIAILGDLLELGEKSAELHKELAEYTNGKADRVFYVGKYIPAFLSGRSDARCYETKEELNFALSSAILGGELSYGDIVLIKGSKGVGMWEQYEFLRKLLEQGSVISAQTRLLVDVDALKHNYAAIKSYVGEGVKIMPVVKADAYGTGADLLANIYNDCNFFAVADLYEAEELHAIMPNSKFLVLYQPLPREADWIAERGEYVVMSVGDADFVRALNKAAIKANKKLSVHIEIDTGMSRLGVLVDDCEELAKIIAECMNLTVEGIFTHYSSADMYAPEDLEYTAMQTERFKKAIGIVESVLGNIPFKHACASAAIFNPKAELFDIVRPGYMLRGYYPCDEIKDKITLKPSLKYVTQVTQIKEFDDDDNASVSYGRNFVTKRKTRLAEIPVGYSDGIMRKLSNGGAFVIKGQLAPIVGSVTMDYTMVDVTDISPMVWVGDEVAIFDNVNMTIERMAELCGTIGYEIITNIRDKTDKVEVF